MSAWLVAFALGVAVPAAALAWAFPWRVRRVTGIDAEALTRRLQDCPQAERVRAAARAAPAGGWLSELCAELEAAEDDRERVAVVNEALRSLHHGLEVAQGWPRAGAWLTALGTLAVVVAGFVLGGRSELLWAVPVGVAGVGVCLAAQGVGQRQAAARRRQTDGLVRALVGELYERVLDMPARRRARRRR